MQASPPQAPGSQPDRNTVGAALRAAWDADSAVTPGDWSPANPAKGQCEPSTFVAWELLGGSIVHGHVFVDDVFSEHHYWNRIDDVDVDFTADQFEGPSGHAADIREVAVLSSDELHARRGEINPTLAARIEALRRRVQTHLAH
jgi:hypothetical protein